MANIMFSKLKDPFPATDIEWRLQSCGEKDGKFWGIALAYVTNRAIQNRLDEVVGPQNWKNEFCQGPDGGVLCGISIKVDDEWVTKYDGADKTNIEAVKGGLSGAMKRAAVQWGIGRYLYNLDSSWVTVDDKGKFSGRTKDNKFFKWNPPELPAWALPSTKHGFVEKETPKTVSVNSNNGDLLELKVKLEEFISSGVLDNDLSSKTVALKLIEPECTAYDRINACLEYCNSIANKKK